MRRRNPRRILADIGGDAEIRRLDRLLALGQFGQPVAGKREGHLNRDRLDEFDANMSALTGNGWRGWGTEQCASNFVTANSPRPVVLPFPAYSCFFPGGPRNEAKFLHFIGSHRFSENFYAQQALTAVAELAADPGATPTVRRPERAAG